jgi:hypothetical protein
MIRYVDCWRTSTITMAILKKAALLSYLIWVPICLLKSRGVRRLVLHTWQRQWAKADLQFYWNFSDLTTKILGSKEAGNSVKNTGNMYNMYSGKIFIASTLFSLRTSVTFVQFYLFGQVSLVLEYLSANTNNMITKHNHNNIDYQWYWLYRILKSIVNINSSCCYNKY